jgi:hypothetical protein
VVIDNHAVRDLARTRLANSPPDPLYRSGDEVDRDPKGWPAAWRDRATLPQ